MGSAERLIASMQELLWERGYSGTSPRAVQKMADVGQGSMYHHFQGKADLAVAAEHLMGRELQTQINERLSSGATTVDKIAAFLTIDEHVLRGCRLGRLVQDSEVASNDELRAPIQTMFVWIQQNIASTLEDGRSNGEIRPDANIEALAATILAVRQGAYVLARAAQSEEPFRKAADGLIEMLTHGVCV